MSEYTEEGTIINVKEVDDHKEYKFEFRSGDDVRVAWIHENEAKATYPALVKEFKKKMKARKEEKKRRKSLGTPEAPPPPGPTVRVPETVKEGEEEEGVKEEKRVKKEKKDKKKEKKAKTKAPDMPPPPPPMAPPDAVVGSESKEEENVLEIETPKSVVEAPMPPEPPQPPQPPEPPRPSASPQEAPPAPKEEVRERDENSEEELSQTEDDPPEKLFRVVRDEGAIVRKYADMSSPLVGNCPCGEIITITDTNRLWFDNDNLCVGIKPADVDEDDEEGYWRVEVISPSKWRGWISMKSHIINRVDNEPKIYHRQALRKKAEALHEITKSMVEVSLVAARHSAQLRSQRSKVFSGCKSLVDKEDPRVLGVLGQLNADELYDVRVSTTVRKGLDKVTSQFAKVQEAEAELATWLETHDVNILDQEPAPGNDSEFGRLSQELYMLQREYQDVESRIRNMRIGERN